MVEDTIKGIFWLLFPVILIFFESTRSFGLYMLGFYGVCLAGLFLWVRRGRNGDDQGSAELYGSKAAPNPKFGEILSDARARQLNHAKEKITQTVNEHIETLARRRRTLVRVDHYGVVDGSAWNKEVQHFVDNVVKQRLTDHEITTVRSAGMNEVFGELVEGAVRRYCDDSRSDVTAVENLSPLEFEELCNSILQKSGWTSRTTKGSGDQGADVVADRDGTTLVVQCKLYTGTVGNKAVQEVIAAKAYYGAGIAAVVCKNGYTKSAIDLATISGVVLLDISELKAFADGPQP